MTLRLVLGGFLLGSMAVVHGVVDTTGHSGAQAPHHPVRPCQVLWAGSHALGQVCPASPPGLPAEHGLVHRHQ